jgi:hypothetical protein
MVLTAPDQQLPVMHWLPANSHLPETAASQRIAPLHIQSSKNYNNKKTTATV